MDDKFNKTDAFNYGMFHHSELDCESFQDLYSYYFTDNSKILKDEIITNVSSLDSIQFATYANYVKNEIQEAYPDSPYETYIDKWINDLNLKIEDFPFSENLKINKYTCKIWSTYDGEDEKNKARFLQKDFFYFTALLEARKLLKLLNDLTPDLHNKSVDHNIFIAEKGFQIFNNLLDFLNIKETTTRGNKAKLSAIWQSDKSRKLIFKDSVSKKEYLDYLNSIFDSSFTTKSFSDGINHIRIIEDWIEERMP